MTESIRNRYMYATFERDRIIKTMIVGFLLGAILMFSMAAVVKSGDVLQDWSMFVFAGLMFCGAPYVWLKLPKLYNVFNPVTWVLLIVKAMISTIIGFVVTPICLIFRIIQSIVYHYKMKRYDCSNA